MTDVVPFMIDVSNHQNTYTQDKLVLLQKQGLRAMVIRAGYGITADTFMGLFVAWARALRMPFGFYWYLYPAYTPEQQINKFKSAVAAYPDAKCFFTDAEEHTLPGAPGDFSRAYLENFYKKAYDLSLAAFPGKKVAVYTAEWCVTAFFPAAAAWLRNTMGWYAMYVKYFPWYQQLITSLGGSWEDYSKPISITNLPLILTETAKHAPPIMPQGVTNYGIWQCNSFIPFTELGAQPSHLDYNLVKKEIFKDWFGIDVTIPVPPPINPTPTTKYVVLSSLKVRSAPSLSATTIAWLQAGDIINVVKLVTAFIEWALLDTGGYCSASPTYIKKV